MKVKISKIIEQEIEIEFPVYYEYGWSFFKILSPNSYISARVKDGEFIIQKLKDMPACVENIFLNGSYITKEEFKKAYEKAMNHIVHEGFLQEFEGATKTELRKAIYESNMDVCNAVNNI